MPPQALGWAAEVEVEVGGGVWAVTRPPRPLPLPQPLLQLAQLALPLAVPSLPLLSSNAWMARPGGPCQARSESSSAASTRLLLLLLLLQEVV